MPPSGSKNRRLQEKLEAIQREISRVESDIKGISRAVEVSDPEEAMRRLRQIQPGAPVGGVQVGGGSVGGQIRESPGEFHERPPVGAPVYRGGAGMVDEASQMAVPKAVPDQRFATYFGSGSLHSVRPLRQERRVQRNKALFMLFIAALVIFLVLNMIL